MASKAEYEKLVQSFVGETLNKVNYFDGLDEDNQPYYLGIKSDFHVINWGIEFELKSNRKFTLWWGHDFIVRNSSGYYGLDIVEDAEWNRKEFIWDVSSLHQWRQVIGKKIISIKSFWVTDRIHWTSGSSSGEETLIYPQDVAITFEPDITYYISLARYAEDNKIWFQADEVIVFFDERTAKQYGLPYLTEKSDGQ